MEIALLYEKDIDHQERIPEMITVVAAVGLGASVPFLVSLLELNPWYSLPAAAASATMVTQLIGESAIGFYSNGGKSATSEGASVPDDLAIGL
ncbi:MAG: hypothetical protein HY912_00820 [Desulfomonile tiedjei]|uniref:Uncharacterized protein n=1 Tax=Desulfomonile tiedjei TaxID=2358 RepID=A0A9D6Z1S3_9BACT|nr:hypothetical protein [Desulfomonile tiedjei]